MLSLALGWGVAGRVLRPLRVMTAATRRISADSLNERLAMTGPQDELKDLADTIDALLERLDGAFTAQRRFVASASHELRIPLTTMRASLDVTDELLEGLLTLARAQHGALPVPRRMADNLIENAIGHNRDSGWIRITTSADDTAARLLIENGGDVLDPAQVAGLAQPFRRLGADRTGSLTEAARCTVTSPPSVSSPSTNGCPSACEYG